jgi:tetratricopeptide (TPR) repeat protein
MHVVLEQSWQMLTAHEAAVLEALAIFQGGFDDTAAIEVAETDLLTLAALAQKSMIRPTRAPDGQANGSARYTMHEMLRQFAEAQVAQRPPERATQRASTLQRHSRYYLHWLQQQTPQLLNAEQHLAMALILADFDNIRAAWQWAVEQQDFEMVALALEGLLHFCYIRGRTHDGVTLLQQAADGLQGQDGPIGADSPAKPVHLLGKILARMGALYADLPDPVHAMPILEPCLAYQQDPRDRAFVLGRMGSAAILLGNHAQAEAWLQESLALSRAENDLPGEAYALHRLCNLAETRTAYQEA